VKGSLDLSTNGMSGVATYSTMVQYGVAYVETCECCSGYRVEVEIC
jgi:hypothetical protein